MQADIQGALDQLNKSWKVFEHRGEPMTKKQVKAVLEYGLDKGYTSTGEFKDSEIDEIINK